MYKNDAVEPLVKAKLLIAIITLSDPQLQQLVFCNSLALQLPFISALIILHEKGHMKEGRQTKKTALGKHREQTSLKICRNVEN